MARREYQLRDRRLVTEYVAQYLVGRRVAYFNLRLGVPPEEFRKEHPEVPDSMWRPWTKWADAVVVTGSSIVLVEGELRRPIAALGEMVLYRDLLAETPELKPYLHLPVELHLVTPKEDPDVIAAAAKQGIKVVIFKPTWALDYLREVGML